MMMSEVDRRIRELGHRSYPMALLSGNRRAEALDSTRVYDLNVGESVSLRGGTSSDLLYVIEGEVDVAVSSGGKPIRLSPESAGEHAFVITPSMSPVTISADAPAVVCRVDGEVMDYLLSWETLGSDSADGGEDARSRIAAVRRSLAFRRLPMEYVEEAFRRMRPLAVAAGSEVVRQGDPGDAFYLIERGRAEVWQTGIYDDEPQRVAELGPGDAFGEEALVLQGSRNATVRMVEDGLLLVLDADDFEALFGRTLVQRVQPAVAKALIESGHGIIDVRYEEEFEDAHMPGCTLIPLHELRSRVGELDPQRSYVVYCKGGSRSAVGTLLLRQRGFDAVSIVGGLRDWPYEVVSL